MSQKRSRADRARLRREAEHWKLDGPELNPRNVRRLNQLPAYWERIKLKIGYDPLLPIAALLILLVVAVACELTIYIWLF